MSAVVPRSSEVACPACGTRNRVPAATKGHPRCASCRADLPWIVDGSAADWDDVVEQATVPVLVDLWAAWCGPCRMVSPVLEQLATEYAGRLKLVKVDVDRSPELMQRFGVQGVPTLLVLDRGRILARQTGAAGADPLRRWIDSALASRS